MENEALKPTSAMSLLQCYVWALSSFATTLPPITIRRLQKPYETQGVGFHLPTHSPDLNPIQMVFSKLKAHLRKIGARTFDQIFDTLEQICDFFIQGHCWNFFVGLAMNNR